MRKEDDMPTYIILGNWTDQGIRNVKETPKRENAFRELCEKFETRVKDVHRTMGRYDVVATVEAPNDVALSAILYSLGSWGTIRTETLRAFTRQETDQALAKMG
jgi:uncharacterized protein with GYD domain